MNKKRKSVILSLFILLCYFVFHIEVHAKIQKDEPTQKAQTDSDTDMLQSPGHSQCVTGWVWLDDDKDGEIGEGENSASEVLVMLYNTTGEYLGKQLTDNIGHFLFKNLQPGLYNVEVIRPFGIRFIDGSSDPTEKWYRVESALCDEVIAAASVPMEKDSQLQISIDVKETTNELDGSPCVKLAWTIHGTDDIHSFNLLRSNTGKKSDARLLQGDILIRDNNSTYTLIDVLVLPSVIYDYWLEVVDVNGNITQHRPVHIQISNPYPHSTYLPIILH